MSSDNAQPADADAQLVARLQQGGAAGQVAFADLYQRHAGRLLAFLMRLTRSSDDALEISQETWLRIHRSRLEFDGRNFRAWMFKIARNICIDRSRRDNPLLAGEEFDPADEQAETDRQLVDMRLDLQPCWDALPTDFQTVVDRRLRGLSYTEISQELSIPESTAMTRWHRAKQDLRNCVEKSDIEKSDKKPRS